MKHFVLHARRGLAMVAGNLGNFAFILLRNKMLASYLGPMGVGWIALVNNLVEVCANLSGAGVSDALGRELARKQLQFTQRQFVSSGLGMLLASLMVVVPATVWLFLHLAMPSGMVVPAALGFATAAVAAATYRFVSGIYLGQARPRVVFHALVWGACFNMVVSGALLLAGWHTYLSFVLLSYVPITLFACLGLVKNARSYFSVRDIVRMPAWRPMLLIALPTVLGTPLETMTLLMLRSATSARLGEVALGQIQPGLQFVILAASLFNAFVGITTSRWDQSGERGFSRHSLTLVAVAVALPIAGGIFMALSGPLWTLLVRLLFTRAFLPGTVAIPWFLGGEALHLGAMLLFSTFFSRKLGMVTLAPRLAALATMALALRFGMDRSLLLVGQAYTISFLVFFVVTLVLWCGFQAKFLRDARTSTPEVIHL